MHALLASVHGQIDRRASQANIEFLHHIYVYILTDAEKEKFY
jgi:hypothetical protein